MLAVPLLVCLYLPMYYGIDAIKKALFLMTVIAALGKCSEQKSLALAVCKHVQMRSSHTAWVEVVDAFMVWNAIMRHQHSSEPHAICPQKVSGQSTVLLWHTHAMWMPRAFMMDARVLHDLA